MCGPDRCGWKMLMFNVKCDRLLGSAEKRGRAVDLVFARLAGLDCRAARTFPHVHVLQTSSAVRGVSLHWRQLPDSHKNTLHTHTCAAIHDRAIQSPHVLYRRLVLCSLPLFLCVRVLTCLLVYEALKFLSSTLGSFEVQLWLFF